MSIEIKWFPPSWVQIKISKEKILYIDPAYLKKYYRNYPKKVEFSTWPDPIDGLPEKGLEKADVILVTHHHKDHCTFQLLLASTVSNGNETYWYFQAQSKN